ncbi:MarR family transcriptional regulator [Bacillus sp. JCM 19041]|uniref:MarR family winged helix-turn-helix transcriptional regulator n=1 Tax=Bacillus sp. JCM 19041 TaxID=1460637 RepID=UPI0006D2126F
MLRHDPDKIGLIIRDLHLEVQSYLTKRLEPLSLAPEQHLLMILLLENDGLSQTEIAEKLNKDKASIARMISSLEKKQYVYRATSKHDGRVILVFVSEKGIALKKDMYRIGQEINVVLEKNFNEDEKNTLKHLLQQIQMNMRES